VDETGAARNTGGSVREIRDAGVGRHRARNREAACSNSCTSNRTARSGPTRA